MAFRSFGRLAVERSPAGSALNKGIVRLTRCAQQWVSRPVHWRAKPALVHCLQTRKEETFAVFVTFCYEFLNRED